MYDFIHTQNDVLRERYIAGAELVGKYQVPQLQPISARLDGLRPVPINLAGKEKNPRECVCHMFVDDNKFEGVWKDPLKQIETLSYYAYVCPCDFSFYYTMPKSLQIYQIFRMRAIHHFLTCCGVKCLPVVTWSDKESYSFCFDGLPTESTLAVSTNGCHTIRAREYYKLGFAEMCERLKPTQILVVGAEIPVECDVPIVYMDGFSQQRKKRMEAV